MDTTDRLILSGGKILVDKQWSQDFAIVIEAGRIKAIIPEAMIAHHLPARRHDFPDHTIVPGFIDVHVHGTHGIDVMDASLEHLFKMCQHLAEEGVTGFLATTMTASQDVLEKALATIATARKQEGGAGILGIHLEGPFLAPSRRGAQGTAVMLPDVELVKHWQSLAQGAIKIITLAPELPGALEFIHNIRALGIAPSIGHTAASYAETNAAIDAGCLQATHLFNAMGPLLHRAPGAVGAILLSELVTAEIIVDGLHLHPAIVSLILKLMHADRLMLITDAMRAKCHGDGVYDLGGNEVTVRNGKATLADGTLAGSTLRMIDAIKNMQGFTDCSLEDALAMATYNPARILGLEGQKGSFAIGADADIVVLDAALNVKMTLRAGKEIFRA